LKHEEKMFLELKLEAKYLLKLKLKHEADLKNN